MVRKIRSMVETPFHEDTEFFDLPENWDEMTEAAQDNYLAEIAVEHQNNVAPCGARVVEVFE